MRTMEAHMTRTLGRAGHALVATLAFLLNAFFEGTLIYLTHYLTLFLIMEPLFGGR